MKHRVALVLVVVTLGACAAPMGLATPSGRPEVVIRGATRAEAADTIVFETKQKGWMIRVATDRQVVVGRRFDNLVAAMLLDSRYDSDPEYRIQFVLADVRGGTRVSARLFIVTNPDSAFERLRDISESRDAKTVQAELERLRDGLQK